MPRPEDAVPYGTATCEYVLAAGRAREECGASAVWHGLWTHNEDGSSPLDGRLGSATPLCPVHTLEMIQRALIIDWHRFGGCCCMPSTVWHFAESDEDTSRCVWVDEDGSELVVVAAAEALLQRELVAP